MELVKFIGKLFSTKQGVLVVLNFVIGLIFILPSVFGINYSEEGVTVLYKCLAGIFFFLLASFFAHRIQKEENNVSKKNEKDA